MIGPPGIERAFNVVLIPADVYYITGLPTELSAHDVALIAAVALAMALVATVYPAWRGAWTGCWSCTRAACARSPRTRRSAPEDFHTLASGVVLAFRSRHAG